MSKPKIDKKTEIPIEILRDLLTPSEIRMLKNRFLIVNYLLDGLSIRHIAEEVQVGTDTVVRVSRMLEKTNLKKVVKKSSTPWVFGKSE